MKKIGLIIGVCFLFFTGCSQAEELVEEESVEATSETTEEKEKVSIMWEENEIIIPELEHDYEVWFLADSHIIIPDENGSERVMEYTAERMSVFENEAESTSAEIFSQFIVEANENKPDMILFGGDILDFPSEKNIAFLKEELGKLTVPYLFVMGNHDWTYPWEYMTSEGAEKYRPMVEEITGTDSYAGLVEWDDVVFLAIDNSSNQVAPEAVPVIEQAYATNKPIILVQHVPFSTENLILRAKEEWSNPVTLGMQVHGGIPVNEISDSLYKTVLKDESQIRMVLAGHVHFSYQEEMANQTVECITDAAFKGKATKLQLISQIQHEYFCDKFMLTVDNKQYDLTAIEPDLSSVSALQPITNEQLFILGRIDENHNMLLVYDFEKEDFVFHEQGITMCWIQDDFESARYLQDGIVYDLNKNVIYEPDLEHTVHMIEYVESDFMVTVTDLEHQNPEQVWVD